MNFKMAADRVDASVHAGKTHCLLIGAAPKISPERALPDNSMDLRRTVKEDLDRMTKYCAKWALKVSYFVTDRGLLPTARPGDARFTLYHSNPGVFKGVSMVRAEVQNLIRTCSDPNMVIFFTGEGGQNTMVPTRELRPKFDGEDLMRTLDIAEVQHSLIIPEATHKEIDYFDYYKDRDLMEDVTKDLRQGQRVYLVLNAPHSGGMFNDWELPKNDRLGLFVALFASSEPDGGEAEGFVAAFTKYATPGIPLIQVQGEIFKSQRGSLLQTMRPEQVNERYLPDDP